MSHLFQTGLPSIWMLVFTLMLWLLFSAILFSNPKNPLNRWGFGAGIIFSLGVFKEYLYFGLAPHLLALSPPPLSAVFCQQIYSIMTAALYYFAMPAVLMMTFYFSGSPQRLLGKRFPARYAVFLPALLLSFIFPCSQTRYYQLNSPSYYAAVSVYNLLFGVLITVLLIRTLRRSRLAHDYQQKSLIAVNVLLPMWYWLLSVFPIHILRIQGLFKLWQGNILIILFLLGYFIYHLFRTGIWGTRLYREVYSPQDDYSTVRCNTQLLAHALKNEVTKIQWCASGLLEKSAPEQADQLEILLRSARHLEYFIERTRFLSQDITLLPSVFSVYPVLDQCIRDFQGASPHPVSIRLHCSREALIFTDKEHFIEIMQNLLGNALDALSRKRDGSIEIRYLPHPTRGCSILSVSDNGQGLSKKDLHRMFQPYYTTKGGALKHLGLGLYYCRYVLERQGGGIRVKSIPGSGTTFLLFFPYRKKKIKKALKENTHE